MGGFLLFVSFVVFVWACVGLIHPASARIPNRWMSVLIWLGSVMVFTQGMSMMPDQSPPAPVPVRAIVNNPEGTRSAAPSRESGVTNTCALYPPDIEAIVVESIMQHAVVRDAALSQRDCALSLVLMVNSAITEVAARELGDNFVRGVKSLGPRGAQDESLGIEIGRSQYDYQISVYASSTQEPIARGAKVAMARRIRW